MSSGPFCAAAGSASPVTSSAVVSVRRVTRTSRDGIGVVCVLDVHNVLDVLDVLTMAATLCLQSPDSCGRAYFMLTLTRVGWP